MNATGTSSRGFATWLPPFLSSIVGWLRAGYPEGVPDVDYIPLFALLGSQLSESAVHAIAEELESESKPESAEAIRKAIATVTDHLASDANVARVQVRLAGGGWPLAKPEQFDPATGPDQTQAPGAALSTLDRRTRRAAPPPRAGPRK
jgi:hypothetical protein